MIRIVDYGVGNIQAFMTMFKRLGITAERALVAADLADASRLILPGVGHFDHAMQRLNDSGMRPALEDLVLGRRVSVVGICVGMQLLADRGLEHGETPGLGWVPGEVRLIEPTDPAIKVPHMGWNDVMPMPHRDGAQLVEQGEAYFLHSYHFAVAEGRDVAAMTDHGGGLVAAVARDNILGVQFHPEKSQAYGLGLLARFLEWKP